MGGARRHDPSETVSSPTAREHAEAPPMVEARGLGAAPGIAIGPAVCLETRTLEVIRFHLSDEELDAEVERLEEAIRSTQLEVGRTQDKVGEALGGDLASIFDAHGLILTDRNFISRIVSHIREDRVNAEWAVHRTSQELSEQFARIETEHLRERGEDLRDVTRYLLRTLQGISHHDLSEYQEEVIVVADELTPSDALRLGRQGVAGFALEAGGLTSHTTIVARALNIPLVTGLQGVVEMVTDKDAVIVNGDEGRLILHPTPSVLESYQLRRRQAARLEAAALRTRDLEAVTLDGVEVELLANVELPEEIEDASRFGATGIGLYRSEFLYIEKSPELPTEEEHLELFRQMLAAMAPHRVIVRTFDLGGRKLAQEVMHIEEENPGLGLRGIRLTLARPEIFRTQLRALYRASVDGELGIMIPLVTTVEEIRRFRAFCQSVQDELRRDGLAFRSDVALGVMIEVPAAALIADRIAREVDFLSLGTNDLIQYALAVDRSNEHVAHLYQPLHPAVLTMLRLVVDAGRQTGVEVSICGEMAGSPDHTALLLGLGLRRFSMSPRAVPAVKARLRELSVAELEEVCCRCTRLSTSDEVAALLDSLGACPGDGTTP